MALILTLLLISPHVSHSLTNSKPNGEVSLQAGKAVSSASVTQHGKFVLKVEKRTADLVDYINANYVLVATGSSQQVWEFLFTPILASCQNIIGHKVASLPILLPVGLFNSCTTRPFHYFTSAQLIHI